jgi:quercetin dioxygenase-like cupin family protein
MDGPRFEVEYTIEGTCLGRGLWNGPYSAVQRAFMSAGSVFPLHVHDCHEHLVVAKGAIVIFYQDQKNVAVGTGYGIHIPIGTAHGVKALEDTWVIGITVPPDRGYPGI